MKYSSKHTNSGVGKGTKKKKKTTTGKELYRTDTRQTAVTAEVRKQRGFRNWPVGDQQMDLLVITPTA